MRTLRLFFVSSIFTYRALFTWLNPSAYLFSKIGFPLIQLSFFALVGRYGGAQPVDFYLLGNALLVAYRPMFTIASAIQEERRQGTLPYVVGSSASRVVLFFGRSAGHALDGLWDVVIAFWFAVVLFGLDLSRANWLGIGSAIVVATLGASAIGLLLGAAAYLVLDAAFLANTAMFGLLLLTGANVPLGELPAWLLPLSWALPLTRSVDATRLYATGASLDGGLALLAGDAVIAMVWAVAGLLLFNRIEYEARRRGTLEGF
jgi:ABC-2 type transport system permease protein